MEKFRQLKIQHHPESTSHYCRGRWFEKTFGLLSSRDAEQPPSKLETLPNIRFLSRNDH